VHVVQPLRSLFCLGPGRLLRYVCGQARGAGQLFGSVEKLGPKVNFPDYDEALASISSDDRTLYFCRILDDPNPSDIWMVKRESTAVRFGDENGPDPRPLEFNSLIYDDRRPCIASDDLFLFFSDYFYSDPRPGGFGDRDIWVTFRSSVDAPSSNRLISIAFGPARK